MSTPAPKRATKAETAWMADGLCRDLPPALFFIEGTSTTWRDEQRSDAVAVCDACPVEHQCLEHAVAFHERWGVWGGVDMEPKDAMRVARAVIAERRQALDQLAVGA